MPCLTTTTVPTSGTDDVGNTFAGSAVAPSMTTASWNGTVIAESDDTVVVEGNHYFPIGDVVDGILEPSDRTSTCPWKGVASYFDVVVGDARNADAAWTYAAPKDAAAQIAGRVAFWKGVQVSV